MTIYYCDEFGIVSVKVNSDGIQFLDGIAYFSDGEKEYKVNIKNICEIMED
jgi:hypothetical protein